MRRHCSPIATICTRRLKIIELLPINIVLRLYGTR